MIPKTIHFVWLGGAPKPKVVQDCIESWRRTCPDWEIREWGDDFAKGVGNRYVREALAHRKWAFAADWIRLHALAEFGGFYLDTDMEMMKPLDPFLENRFVISWERISGKTNFNCGVIGCEPGSEIVRELLDVYRDLPFVKEDGELDLTPNTERLLAYAKGRWGVRAGDGTETVRFADGCVIYPWTYFLPRDGYTFHHYSASWLDAWVRKVWFRAGPYKLVRLKRRKEADADAPVSEQDGERRLMSIPIGSRKRLALVRRVVRSGSRCAFVSVVRDREMYDRLVRDNPCNAGGEFVAFDNLSENLPVTTRYNSFLDGWDYSEKAWFVFLHEDFEFLEPPGAVLDGADPSFIYGTCGARSTRPGDDVTWSLNSNRDGSGLGLYGRPFSRPVEVQTVDCNCLIVHSDLVRDKRLRFDEGLTFDLYAEDFCIDAFERHGIRAMALPVLNHHYSFGHIGPRFFAQRRYLMGKYAGASRAYGTTTKQAIGPIALVVAARRANRRWRRRGWLRKIGRFFWYAKHSRDGRLRLRVLGLPLKFPGAGRYAAFMSAGRKGR